jgi:hypothetical protein
MSLPIKHKPKSGMWFQKGYEFYWKEYNDTFGKTFKLYKPTELYGISREAVVDIVFIKEYPDVNSFNGKARAFFKQRCRMSIRPETTENIVLKFGDDKKYYLVDISALGKCIQAPLENTDMLTVEMDEPVKLVNKKLKS